MSAYVLFVLRVYLAATVSYLHYVMVHAMVHTAASKPSRQLRRPQRHAPNTTPFNVTTAETLG